METGRLSQRNCSVSQVQTDRGLNRDEGAGLAGVKGGGMEITLAMRDLSCLKLLLLLCSECSILQYHIGNP